MELPAGFVLDEQPQQQAAPLPEGFVMDAQPTQAPIEQPQEAGRLASAIGGASQGVTFGFGDEIEAGLASVIPIDRMVQLDGSREVKFGDFKGNLEQIRERNAVQRESNPKTFLAGEVAGGLGTGGAGVAKLGATKAAVAGGAAFGAGTAEGGLEERGKGAAVGGALGFVGGEIGKRVVAPLATKLASGASTVLQKAIEKKTLRKALTKPQRRALAKYQSILKKSDVTAEEFAEKVRKADAVGLDDDFLLDLGGDQALQVAKGLAVSGNQKALEGIKKVRERQTMQQFRVEDELKAVFGSGGDDIIEKSKAIQKAKKAADPFYEKFRSLKGQSAEDVRGVLGSDFDNIVAQASKSAERRTGKALDTSSGDLSPDVLDRMKRTLSERTQAATRNGDPTEIGDASALERRFVAFMDDAYPDIYAKARATFAGPAQQQNALDLGEGLLRGTVNRRNPEKIADTVRKMSDDEAASFRIGVARAIRVEMQKGNTGKAGSSDFGDPTNLIKKFFNTTEKREVIRAAFGNDAQFDRFAAKMAKLDDQSETFRQVNVQRSGSPTAPLQGARDAVVDLGTDALEAKGGNVFALKRIAQRLLPKGNTETQDALADLLFTKAPKERQAIQATLVKLQGRERDAKIAELLKNPAGFTTGLEASREGRARTQ